MWMARRASAALLRHAPCTSYAPPCRGFAATTSEEAASSIMVKGNRVLQALVGRRTVSNFDRDQPVPEISVLRALEAARWAPNHRLTEPWRFWWLGEQAIEAVASLAAGAIAADGKAARAARKYAQWKSTPGWMVVTSRRSDDPLVDREDYAACCCAVQNFMVALHSEGVGSKWSTVAVIETQAMADAVGYSLQTDRVVGIVYFGLAQPEDTPTSLRRKPLTELLVRVP